MPPITPPTEEQLKTLLADALPAWQTVNALVEGLYEMDTLWSTGGKKHPYEYKYRRGGKTLCALYPHEGRFGFMVVLGRAEQEKVEADFANFTPATQEEYLETHPYHDGRWLMLYVTAALDDALLEDIRRLLAIKRRPNRKV